MARGIRRLIESVVFAGLKPGAHSAQPRRMRWLGPLLRPVERFLSGGITPSDPLYLSHRTPRQRFLFALKIAAPVVVLAGIAAWMFRGSLFDTNQPKGNMTPAELAARMLPDLDRLKVETNRDIEVPSVGIDRSGPLALAGTVRNNTPRVFDTVEILCELTDANGSKLGGVTAQVRNLAPKSQADFRVSIAQQTAVAALVRDIRAQ